MKYKPSISFLPKLSQIKNIKEQEKNVENLNKLFKEHKIKAEVKGFETGPVISKYHVYLLKGGKHKDVSQMHKEIALTTGSKQGCIRVSGPIPGKHYFNIESVNNNITTLPLRYFLESPKMLSDESKLVVPFGLQEYGDIKIEDIRDQPHLLVAGMKNSGRTTFLHTIITSLILRNSPEELKFILIASKTTKFDVYKKIPYLAKPILKNQDEIKKAFEWAEKEIFDRFGLFENNKVTDIERYNEKNKEKLERIVIVVQDLSKCFSKTPALVERCVVRIAQYGRSAGVHLVIGTSDTSSKTITGLMAANIPTRSTFKLNDSKSSNRMIYRSGAEELLGKGDMLYMSWGTSTSKRLQTPYISKEDLEKLIKKVAV